MSATIKIKNGFLDKTKANSYLLACQLIDGAIEVNNFLMINNKAVGKISKIEKHKINSYVIAISMDSQFGINVSDLYGKTFIVRS